MHEYDPASDRWQRPAPLPTTRGALAAAVLDGKIHAVGGIGWPGRNAPAHEVYDPAANRWTELAYVPTARDHLALAALEGRLYAVGGRVNGDYSRNLGLNEAYDPASNRWEHRAPMPTARSGIAAAVLEGRIFQRPDAWPTHWFPGCHLDRGASLCARKLVLSLIHISEPTRP